MESHDEYLDVFKGDSLWLASFLSTESLFVSTTYISWESGRYEMFGGYPSDQ